MVCLLGGNWEKGGNGFDLILDSSGYKCKYIKPNEMLGFYVI